MPKSLAGNVEASAETGSLIKTFLVWFAVVSVGYWLYYFLATFLASTHITRALWNPVREIIYPPLYPEHLPYENIVGMLVVMLLLAVGIASLAVFLKYHGKKPQT